MANNDRVTELYRGEILGAESQQICRDRIHWMCSQIVGGRVLDIGCSQGITSILAAREAQYVVGVDVEASTIEFAQAELAKETQAVQGRLRFILADIYDSELDTQLEKESFDTVVLAEILEHQTRPRRLFERACEFLKPGGVIVAATPFGLHVHDDHKFTFYLTDVMETIEGLWTLRSIEVVDGYIRFTVGHKTDTAEEIVTGDRLLALSELAFRDRELRDHRWKTDRAKHHARLEGKHERLVDKSATLTDRVAKLSKKLEGERIHIAELMKQRSEQKKELAAQAKTIETLKNPGGKQTSIGRHAIGRHTVRGPLGRGWKALSSTVKLEVAEGRVFRDPGTSAKKTYARVRRAVRSASNKSLPKSSPKSTRSENGPRATFPPFEPHTQAKGRKLKIATILDTFSHHCFAYEADLISLSLANWKGQLQTEKPAFLFCESAWQGNDGQWKYLMSKFAKREENPLRDLLVWCKQNGLPTVFWNKEDPPNFEVFKDVAKEFDFIFTTDEDCIPKYKALANHDRVYALPFAAQPAIHNPIQDNVRRDRDVCFAGSWLADKYPERVADTEMLLRPALAKGLEIFDRHYGTQNAEKFAFPQPYAQAVAGSLDYDQMLTAYRAYKAFLNVNSVTDSPTMFSRRVFELMACGTPVVSSASAGVTAMLGTLVKTVESEEQVTETLSQLLEDDEYRKRFAHTGHREVMRHHTYSHRLNTILEKLGTNAKNDEAPCVTVLAATNRPEQLGNLLSNVRRQTHPNIELVLLLNSDRFDKSAVEKTIGDMPNVSTHVLPESFTLADCLNHGIDHSKGEYLAKFDDDDYYGADYLSDLLMATAYTDAGVLGKHAYYCYVTETDQMALRNQGHSHRHKSFVCGATLFVRRDVFDLVRFTPVRQGTDTIFLKDCKEQGVSIYSADPYNYLHIRSADMSDHTWKITAEDLLKNSSVIRKGLALDEVMI